MSYARPPHLKDLLPSQKGWIHELARAETLPDSVQSSVLTQNPDQCIEESTIRFLADLREELAHNVKLFNALSENGTLFQEIKVYSVAQTAADFMLFRNQLKLLITHRDHGVVEISFAQHVRGTLSVDGQQMWQSGGEGLIQDLPPQLFTAQLGAFHDVTWTFHGEKVSPQQIAKFYFTEFVKCTRESNHSIQRPGSDQVLLDQIKALLEKKGLGL